MRRARARAGRTIRSNDDPAVPPQPGAPRGAAAAGRRRRARRRAAAGPPGRAARATAADLLDARSRPLDATDAAALRWPRRSSRARGRGRGCGDCSTERHPPDAATVERVLARRRGVDAGHRRGRGWRVAPHRRGRLGLVGPLGRAARRAGRGPIARTVGLHR